MANSSFPPLRISALLRKYNLRPRKGLAQHFLVDDSWLIKVVAAGEILKKDMVLEVGSGLGHLTRYLAQSAGYVVSVEIDKKLIPPLQEVLSIFDNVKIIEGDILTIRADDLLNYFPKSDLFSSFSIVANIPYHITSLLIRRVLEDFESVKVIVFTIQYEVAMRIIAQPPDMSLLALSVQVYGEPEFISRIPAGAFYPSPKVDSAILRIRPYSHPLIHPSHLNTFFRLANSGFNQKRKTLRNSLSAGLGIPKTQIEQLLLDQGIDPNRRAQTLDIEEWKDLTLSFDKNKIA